jgi:hypothetical protein
VAVQFSSQCDGRATIAAPDRVGAAKMPASFVNDPEHWRNRAKETRAIADKMNDPRAKEKMLKIVDYYERLAKQAEEQAKRPPQSN